MFSLCRPSVRLSVRPLSPILRDAISFYLLERFKWNLPQIFVVWVGIAEKYLKVGGQGHDHGRPNAMMAKWCILTVASFVIFTMQHVRACVCVCVLSWHPDVRGVEAERFASSQSDRQRYNARLKSFSFPDQWATEHRTAELPRLHHRRARRQQRCVHATVTVYQSHSCHACLPAYCHSVASENYHSLSLL